MAKKSKRPIGLPLAYKGGDSDKQKLVDSINHLAANADAVQNDLLNVIYRLEEWKPIIEWARVKMVADKLEKLSKFREE